MSDIVRLHLEVMLTASIIIVHQILALLVLAVHTATSQAVWFVTSD